MKLLQVLLKILRQIGKPYVLLHMFIAHFRISNSNLYISVCCKDAVFIIKKKKFLIRVFTSLSKERIDSENCTPIRLFKTT